MASSSLTVGLGAGSKRPAEQAVGNPEDLLTIQPLGSGQEVGRSCHVLKYKNKTVMVRLVHFHNSF